MMRDKVLAILKANRTHLDDFHVKDIYLFGSVARGDENPQSDIDVLVAFDSPATFDSYMDLKFFLEDLFQKKVDLVTEEGLRPELRKSVAEDLIHAA